MATHHLGDGVIMPILGVDAPAPAIVNAALRWLVALGTGTVVAAWRTGRWKRAAWVEGDAL